MEALGRFEDQDHADDHDEEAHGERGQGLETPVAVRVVFIRFSGSKPDRHVDHGVGHEVGQRVEGVGQQGHASEDEAAHGLQRRQHEVDQAPEERDASCCAVFVHGPVLTR